MKLILLPLKHSDLAKAFELYKSELHSVIDAAIGWNEVYQQNRFRENYSVEWFYWIECEGNIFGYVCYDCRTTELHVPLLILDKQFQGKGIGKTIMKTMVDRAQEKQLKLTLSSFKNNQKAVTFYEKFGFQIVSQDDYFFDFEFSG